jgi:hypothetical protein
MNAIRPKVKKIGHFITIVIPFITKVLCLEIFLILLPENNTL